MMKFSSKIRNWIITITVLVLLGFVIFNIFGGTQEGLPVIKFYGYDPEEVFNEEILVHLDAEHRGNKTHLTEFKMAKESKEIIWYNAKHRDAPLDKIFGDGLNWFKKNL